MPSTNSLVDVPERLSAMCCQTFADKAPVAVILFAEFTYRYKSAALPFDGYEYIVILDPFVPPSRMSTVQRSKVVRYCHHSIVKSPVPKSSSPLFITFT